MRYAVYFGLSVLCLTTGALLTFDHISVSGVPVQRVDSLAAPMADTLPSPEVATPAVPTAADYRRFAAADSAWRQKYAHQYTLAELRARGDGRRSPRDSVQDRVFRYVRSGQRGRAIAELERWLGGHPRDRELLLSLARLLAESGQSDAAIRRYRQLLALQRAE
jgi:Flp pilus assembly protein TadD